MATSFWHTSVDDHLKMRDESPFLGRKREGEARKQEDQKRGFKAEEAASEVRLPGTRLDQDASQVGEVGMALGQR